MSDYWTTMIIGFALLLLGHLFGMVTLYLMRRFGIFPFNLRREGNIDVRHYKDFSGKNWCAEQKIHASLWNTGYFAGYGFSRDEAIADLNKRISDFVGHKVL